MTLTPPLKNKRKPLLLMMMISIGGSPAPVYKAPIKIAQAPPPPEGAEEVQIRTGEQQPSKAPPTTIETNSDRTVNDGNGRTILDESSSERTTVNRFPPTVDLKIKRTRVIDKTSGTSQNTTAIGSKVSTTGFGGSASVDLSDSTTVKDHIPANTAIGRTEGDTCKLVQKTADGKIKKFEAKKPEGGTCIEGELPLTPNNHIEDGDTTIFTQQRLGLPAGVTIEYKQIPKK